MRREIEKKKIRFIFQAFSFGRTFGVFISGDRNLTVDLYNKVVRSRCNLDWKIKISRFSVTPAPDEEKCMQRVNND